ncbi:SIS domain-containing protein [Rhodoblastus acidophilus]|uniref:Phosphoheptose isomerase n=1 Tax=Candidatus Rhodoblastus alkanivorans TaxID=2954117 RepID=A0ABS9Z8C3_9HYPH|nr:SIS domain-containing protein [Candidatus Rhodoblastus alkanivorans]MCI4679474.1 SIS domain-containing protein [Candidatus Rhodoblastus alkanivorans]MCI4683919.1 SIS domain-containing protein [Candidatus Rhodoblastus alkanivorans]MDI4641238.1 SIS domain-containing protein [Rhodoblastus acidophilus]
MTKTDDLPSPRSILAAGIEMHAQVIAACLPALEEPFAKVVEICESKLKAGGKMVFFGNGGSAADAQHIATELTIRFTVDRPAIAALALTTDTSALTACANDLGFDQIFARQVEALVRENDAVIGISTSGRSANVLAGLREAKKLGAATIGLTGGTGGDMPSLCDAVLCAPSKVTARIQEIHILLGHLLCETLEKRMGYVTV